MSNFCLLKKRLELGEIMKKVLIVDDDPLFVESICTLMDSHGYGIATASDGKAGFEKAMNEQPALILLDVMMARKTEGYDLARNLCKEKKTKNIPIILITGIKNAAKLPFELQPDEDWLPVKAVLEKPVKPDELIRTVNIYIK